MNESTRTRWTFMDIMKHENFAASLVIACIKETGLRGTLSHGERTWPSDEAKKIIALAHQLALCRND